MIKYFGEWAANPDLAFSDTALHQARLSFIDTLACMIAATDDPLVCHVANAMENAGARGLAATVVPDVRLSAPAAALVNGAAVHASIHNHFNQDRHLNRRDIFRPNRSAALAEWRQLAA